jgi:hypothetical protein
MEQQGPPSPASSSDGDMAELFTEVWSPTVHTVRFPVTDQFASAFAANSVTMSALAPQIQLVRIETREDIASDDEGNRGTSGTSALQIRVESRSTSADAARAGGDLTGFTLFPETSVISQYLADRAALLAGRNMVELGAGLAMPSHVALACGAQWPVVVSDGCADVLSLLAGRPGLEPWVLPWTGEVSKHPQHRNAFDICFGSGIAYSLSSLPGLFATARALLKPEPTARFLIGFTSRQVTRDAMEEAATSAGFNLVIGASDGSNLGTKVVDAATNLGVFAFCPVPR